MFAVFLLGFKSWPAMHIWLPCKFWVDVVIHNKNFIGGRHANKRFIGSGRSNKHFACHNNDSFPGALVIAI